MKTIRMRWDEHVARMRYEIYIYKILVENPESKRPFRRPRCRWETNIRMDLRE